MAVGAGDGGPSKRDRPPFSFYLSYAAARAIAALLLARGNKKSPLSLILIEPIYEGAFCSQPGSLFTGKIIRAHKPRYCLQIGISRVEILSYL